jgi:hypothetical protein
VLEAWEALVLLLLLLGAAFLPAAEARRFCRG